MFQMGHNYLGPYCIRMPDSRKSAFLYRLSDAQLCHAPGGRSSSRSDGCIRGKGGHPPGDTPGGCLYGGKDPLAVGCGIFRKTGSEAVGLVVNDQVASRDRVLGDVHR